MAATMAPSLSMHAKSLSCDGNDDDGVSAASSSRRNEVLRAKLSFLLNSVARLFNARSTNIAAMQVWFRDDDDQHEQPPPPVVKGSPAAAAPTTTTVSADAELSYACDDAFARFCAAGANCRDPARLSMPGRCLRGGGVVVVQALRVLPPAVHPRKRLLAADAAGALAARAGGAVYVPVYDLSRGPPQGGGGGGGDGDGINAAGTPAAVIEALLAAGAADGMLPANLTSLLGSRLAALGLSLSSPLPQPVLPSALAGRRPRPPADADASFDRGSAEAEGARFAPPPRAKPPQQQPHKRPSAGAAPVHLYMGAAAAANAATAAPPTAAPATSSGLPPRAPPPAVQVAAASAPPALCRGDDDDDAGCGGGGGDALGRKRARCGDGGADAAAAALSALRRAKSVPRGLAEL